MSTLELPSEATRVIRAVFGAAAVEDALALTGGRSGAQVFSVRIAGRAYVIRVPAPGREKHDERSNREITSMALAAERGVGPELRHADRATGITISARIDGLLDGRERALAPGRIERLASTVRRVHEGPRLPEGAGVAGLMEHFDGALRARGTGGIPAALAAALRDATDASRRFEKRAPCHNDLNPSNVLETAERTYLVDWETAGEGDPFVDVAQLGVFSLFAPGARADLLAAYLGRAAPVRGRSRSRARERDGEGRRCQPAAGDAARSCLRCLSRREARGDPSLEGVKAGATGRGGADVRAPRENVCGALEGPSCRAAFHDFRE